jgi:hypothetical protein
METDKLIGRFEMVMAGLLFIGVANTALTAVELTGYGYDIDYSEGFFIEDTQRLMDTGNLYPEPSLENGFESVKYPPLFYLVFGVLAELLGYSFLTGRLINIAAVAASTALVFMLARDRVDTDFLLLPAMFLVPYLTVFTTLTIRTDLLALAFSLGGLYLVSRDRLFHALPLFVMAALTKQVFISGFLASAFYLARREGILEELLRVRSLQDGRKAIESHGRFWKFAGGYTAAGILSIVILQAVYPQFLENIFIANMGGFSVRFDLLNWVHLTFLPLFGLAGYYIYVFRDRLLGSYLVLSLVIMLFQMTRGGAWVHSAIQPFAAAVICSSVLYQRLKHTGIGLPVSILLIVQLVVLIHAPFVSGSVLELSSMADRNAEADSRISEEVMNRENVYTEHPGYLIMNGKEAPVEIWGMYEQYSSGRVTGAQVEDFFRRKNYSSIVTYKRLERLPLDSYINENYQRVDTVGRRDMLLNREEWRIYRWTG